MEWLYLQKRWIQSHNIYLLAQLLGQDGSNALNNLEHYAENVYIKRKQADKDEAIEKAYKKYKRNGNSWMALEDLRKASDNHCTLTLSTLTDVSNS